MFQGSRHWCVKGKHIIGTRVVCSFGRRSDYNEKMFGPATTHNDNMCMECLQVARRKYNATDPKRFRHGEGITVTPVSQDATKPEMQEPNKGTE